MEGEYQEITIVGVDKEKITVSPDKKGFWVVSFRLSQKPDPIWERKFYEVSEKNKKAVKIKYAIVNDCFEIEISENDGLQDVLDVLKVEVAETNAQCLDDYQKKVKIRQDLDALRQRENNTRQHFKDDADNLKF